MGLIAHAALQRVVEEAWPAPGWLEFYDHAWGSAAAEHGVADWRRLPAAPRAYFAIRRWLEENASTTYVAHAEVSLTSPGGTVVGKADLVVESQGGRGVLDLKTGMSADLPLEGHTRRQLLVYAAMLDLSGAPVDWLGLISASGKHQTIPHDPVEAHAILAQIREAGAAADGDEAPPGRPDMNVCFDCAWLHGCREGREELSKASRRVEALELEDRRAGPSALLIIEGEDSPQRVAPIVAHEVPVPSRCILVSIDDRHRLIQDS